ncbi:MAG: hypothetical protein WAW13_02105 [Minisyncoccia bacterium]
MKELLGIKPEEISLNEKDNRKARVICDYLVKKMRKEKDWDGLEVFYDERLNKVMMEMITLLSEVTSEVVEAPS